MNSLIANRYSLLHKLGEGGMADVYLAIDTILNREVAVKVLRGDLATDPVAVLRFKREANAALALNHPNIVEIYDVGEEEGKHYIVMEYIKGKTLKQLIAQRGALDKDEAVYIMKQLLSAMVHAHKNNVVHRDIKPQNILIKDDGTIKLSDFGIALAQNTAQAQLTQADAVLGSVHYLAPEIARGEQATEQSDIYSLGIVFYELLCGDVPYRGEAPVQVAMKHMREEIPSIRSFNPTIPQALENVIIKATAKNKLNRYKNVHAMSKDTETCLDPKREQEEKLVFEPEEAMHDKTIVLTTTNGNTAIQKKNRVSLSFERLLGLSVLLFSVIAIGAIVFLTGNTFFKRSEQVTIPDVVGYDLESAITKLEDLKLQVNPVHRYEMSNVYERGKVVGVVEGIDNVVKPGSSVQLIVSEGKYFVVGNYVGMSIDDATALIEGGTRIKVKVNEEESRDYTPGTIIRQDGKKEGDKVNPSIYAEILFTVAKAPSLIMVDVIGWNYEEAYAMLSSLGFKVEPQQMDRSSLTPEELEQIEEGKIIDQTPKKDTAWSIEDPVVLYFY